MTDPATALHSEGFCLLRQVVTRARVQQLLASVEPDSTHRPGTRNMLAHDWCRALAAELRASPELQPLLPANYVAIQCTCFTKSAEGNWLVPIHQDTVVPVAPNTLPAGWGPRTRKEGGDFARAPLEVLESLIAVRLHLDACTARDGPLVVVPRSHARGLLGADAAAALRADSEVACAAEAGDALVLRPLLLHRSSKATGESRRRVLHFLYAPALPAPGMAWLQVL